MKNKLILRKEEFKKTKNGFKIRFSFAFNLFLR